MGDGKSLQKTINSSEKVQCQKKKINSGQSNSQGSSWRVVTQSSLLLRFAS